MYVWIDRYRIIKKKKKLDAYCFIDTKREREKKKKFGFRSCERKIILSDDKIRYININDDDVVVVVVMIHAFYHHHSLLLLSFLVI